MSVEKKIDYLEKKAKLKLTAEEREKFKKDYLDFLSDLKQIDRFDDLMSSVKEEDLINKDWLLTHLRNDEKDLNNSSNVSENAINFKEGYIVYKK